MLSRTLNGILNPFRRTSAQVPHVSATCSITLCSRSKTSVAFIGRSFLLTFIPAPVAGIHNGGHVQTQLTEIPPHSSRSFALDPLDCTMERLYQLPETMSSIAAASCGLR